MPKKHVLSLTIGLIIFAGLYWVSVYDYLLFHSIAELFSIIVACGIFMIAWNSRRLLDNNYLLFIGIAYLFVAAIDTAHTLAYEGMGVFRQPGANLSTQLWISARYLESLSLLLAPFFLGRRLKVKWIFSGYVLIFFLFMGALFYWRIFPVGYIEGVGLTPFKKASEYAVSLALLFSAVFLFQKRAYFDGRILALLISSIAATIASEMFFTLYVHVYGISNFIGHLLKIISSYLIYLAIIKTGLEKPYGLLFRDLKQQEEALKKAHDDLEWRVKDRTAALEKANAALQKEIMERKRTEAALRESEEKYSSLVEESLIGVYMDQNGIIIFANDRFAQIYGYEKEEIIGMDSLSLVHPEDLDRVKMTKALRLRGEEVPDEYEAKGLTKDGRTIWVTRRNRLIHYRGKPAILGNIVDITRRKTMEVELHQLSGQLLTAEENERKRIARELHDGIGQSLSAIKFSLESTLNDMARVEPADDLQALKAIIPLTQKTIEEVRRVVMDLRPSILDDLGILPTINWVCREFQRIYSGIRIDKDISVHENEVPDPLKTVIYRVLQEALNNIAKHSRADSVRLTLSKGDGRLEMRLEDSGIGFSEAGASPRAKNRRGFGLTNMRERALLAGGTFTISSPDGQGTVIQASWPVRDDLSEESS